jgi:hypothetical protein
MTPEVLERLGLAVVVQVVDEEDSVLRLPGHLLPIGVVDDLRRDAR